MKPMLLRCSYSLPACMPLARPTWTLASSATNNCSIFSEKPVAGMNSFQAFNINNVLDMEQDSKTVTVSSSVHDGYSLNNANDLDALTERIGDARCVMLGEASHGTHEYYTWRAAITKRLVREKKFNFIAVEGDWPDCYRLNRYIKGYADQGKKPHELLHDFDRWPTWMWANWEIDALLNWLKEWYSGMPANKRIGFYGLDVYSLWESMGELVKYLETSDPKAAELAKQAIRCFEPYGEDAQDYARSQYTLEDSCRQEVVSLLTEVRKKAPIYDHDPEAALNVEQNAHIAVNAEEYYANMIGFTNSTWNLRDTHMM